VRGRVANVEMQDCATGSCLWGGVNEHRSKEEIIIYFSRELKSLSGYHPSLIKIFFNKARSFRLSA
jgi:hypothetical protein